MPQKLGYKNYDYDVFIVLMRPLAKGNLPNTQHKHKYQVPTNTQWSTQAARTHTYTYAHTKRCV